MSDDLTRLTDEERAEIFGRIATLHDRFLPKPAPSHTVAASVHQAVESILAARTAALIERLEGTREYHTDDCMDAWMLPCLCGGDTRRADRAERERAVTRAELARERMARALSDQQARQLRLELAALRAAVTGLADEWEAAEIGVPSPDTALSGNECAADLRALLTDEGDNP